MGERIGSMWSGKGTPFSAWGKRDAQICTSCELRKREKL